LTTYDFFFILSQRSILFASFLFVVFGMSGFGTNSSKNSMSYWWWRWLSSREAYTQKPKNHALDRLVDSVIDKKIDEVEKKTTIHGMVDAIFQKKNSHPWSKERGGLWQRSNHRLLSTIQSLPFKRNPETRSTLCALTARENARKYFNLRFPNGNAADAVRKQPIDPTHTVTLTSRDFSQYIRTLQATLDSYYSQTWTNVWDVSVKSSSKYGHRAVLFRDSTTGRWWILDPYRRVSGYAATDPKPAEEYFAKRGNSPLMMQWYAAPVGVQST
jgi:hypothetical protein